MFQIGPVKSVQAFPKPLETEETLLEKAKKRCVALFLGDTFVAMGYYGQLHKDRIRTAGKPLFNVPKVTVRALDCSAVYETFVDEIGYPGTDIALVAHCGLKNYIYWPESSPVEKGHPVTIFGFNGQNLVAKTGEVTWCDYSRFGAVITCSLGSIAIGSPVVDRKGSALGMVSVDLGEMMRILWHDEVQIWWEDYGCR